VATPTGPKPIESVRIGDDVIGFGADGAHVTRVAEVHDNGEQVVIPLRSGGREYLAATAGHRLLACHENALDKRRPHLGKPYERLAVSELNARYRVRRTYAGDLIVGGRKNMPLAYVLGALLGDGASRNNKSTTGELQRTLHISSGDERIPAKMAGMLGSGFRRTHTSNYNWALDVGRGALDAVPFYREWCAGRYAHEKVALWDEIGTWDRDSALEFLAGVVDTDGSIYYKDSRGTEAVLNIAMQAKSVVECCDNIIFKFFQDRLSVGIDARDKYVNGPVYSAKTTSNVQVYNILTAIGDRLAVKGEKVDTSRLAMRNIRADRIGFKQGTPRVAMTFDITVGNDTNLYCLHQGGVVTSNSGKTERAKRFVVRECMKEPGPYFIAAPTRDQVKRIYWADVKRLSFCSVMPDRPSETDLIIRYPNGSSLSLIGLDQPQRMEGSFWAGGVVDEIADTKPEAWPQNISPALDTVNPLNPDYRAWCWLIGVPDGMNHYADLAEYARTGNDPDWKLYTWHSADILPADVIEAAKRRMSARQYRQEYEASFETSSGRIYDDYGPANTTDARIEPHEQLLWTHDFNFTPLSSAVAVRRGDSVYFLEEIVLTSAVARQSAQEFVERYKDHKNRHVVVYGDPSGRAGEKHSQNSDYSEIEQVLRSAGWTYTRKVRPSTVSIKDGQNAVRAKIQNAAGERSLFVHPNTAPYTHKALLTGQLKKGSTFLEEDGEYQHIGTAVRYMISYEFPVPGRETRQIDVMGGL